MLNTVRVKVDHGRDFHRLADHMTKLQNFTECEMSFQSFHFHFT